MYLVSLRVFAAGLAGEGQERLWLCVSLYPSWARTEPCGASNAIWDFERQAAISWVLKVFVTIRGVSTTKIQPDFSAWDRKPCECPVGFYNTDHSLNTTLMVLWLYRTGAVRYLCFFSYSTLAAWPLTAVLKIKAQTPPLVFYLMECSLLCLAFLWPALLYS